MLVFIVSFALLLPVSLGFQENETSIIGLNLEGEPEGGQTWIQKEIEFLENSTDVTICFAIKLRFALFDRVVFFTIQYDVIFGMQGFEIVLVQGGHGGENIFAGRVPEDVYQWKHFCVIMGLTPSVYLDGESVPLFQIAKIGPTSVDFSVPFNVTLNLPSGLLPAEIGSFFSGYVTVPHVYSRMLTKEEVRAISNNEEIQGPDLSEGEWQVLIGNNHELVVNLQQGNISIIDNAADNTPDTGLQLLTAKSSAIFLPRDELTYHLSEGRFSFEEAKAVCELMNGTLPDFNDGIFQELMLKQMDLGRSLLTWVVQDSGMPDKCTVLPLSPTLDRFSTMAISCLEKSSHLVCKAPFRYTFDLRHDTFAKQKQRFYFAPEGSQMQFFSLDGKMVSSKIDYTTGHFFFLHDYLKQESIATSPFGISDNPFKRRSWTYTASNETKNNVLTPCLQNEFTCNNGSCIDVKKRCNGRNDCEDDSDEICEIVKSLTQSYRPNRPHRPVTLLNLRVELVKISTVDIELSHVKFQFKIETSWKDGRITLIQLSDEREDNLITTGIWKPEYWFNNGLFEDNKDYLDRKNVIQEIVANKVTNGTRKVIDSFEGYEFRADYDANFTRIETVAASFDCDFDLLYFPFESHTCVIHLKLKQRGAQAPYFNTNEINVLPVNFTLHLFITQPLCYTTVDEFENTTDEVKIHMLLNRRYGSYIFTTFLPCVVLTFIGSLTQFFEYDNFSDRIMVTLSCLIVIAALFSQLTASVPESAQPKLIDVFFFYSMIRLFISFLHHTILSVLKGYVYKKEVKAKEIVENQQNKSENKHISDGNVPGAPTYSIPDKNLMPVTAWQVSRISYLSSSPRKATADKIFNIISIISGYMLDIIAYCVFAFVIVNHNSESKVEYKKICKG